MGSVLALPVLLVFFFFSSRRRHTRFDCDWSSDVCSSDLLTRLINQVLDLAKIESGAAEWHSSEIDMREVLEDSVTAVSQLFKERGVELTLELPQKVPAILADRDRLMQVMLNLLSNAAKFCERSPGVVTVALAEQSGFLCVEGRHNGIVIEPPG